MICFPLITDAMTVYLQAEKDLTKVWYGQG